MRAAVLLPLLLVACGDAAPSTDEILAGRRIALGLPETPLPFREAMREMKRRGLEEALERDGDLFEPALRIENLLARAGAADRDDAFREALRAARGAALALAREAAAGEPSSAALAAACKRCHVSYRK